MYSDRDRTPSTKAQVEGSLRCDVLHWLFFSHPQTTQELQCRNAAPPLEGVEGSQAIHAFSNLWSVGPKKSTTMV